MTEMVTVTFDVDAEEAEALAQFCKRVYRDAVRPLAGDDAEADDMVTGLMQLRQGLSAAGFSPR